MVVPICLIIIYICSGIITGVQVWKRDPEHLIFKYEIVYIACIWPVWIVAIIYDRIIENISRMVYQSMYGRRRK